MNDFRVIIMAAGEGKRMKSRYPKVLFNLCGKPMVSYVIELARTVTSTPPVVIIGHGADKVREMLGGERVIFVEQIPQLGTGHAIMRAESIMKRYPGNIVILSGDVPLLQVDTLKRFIKFHISSNSDLTVMTSKCPDPSGYGRIIRERNSSKILRIVEDRDASEKEKRINEINTGIYCVSAPLLFSSLHKIKPINEQKEYYLTDAIEIIKRAKKKVSAFLLDNPDESLGINNRIQLVQVEKIMRESILNDLMLSGVSIVDPSTTFVDHGVRIGIESTIHPFTFLVGNTEIGEESIVGPGCFISNSRIGNGVNLMGYCAVYESIIEDNAIVGPFSHLRPGTHMHKKSKVGSFVETKKSIIGKESKIPHLSYVGDSTLGEKINIGAGVITCNYDGVRKHKTRIKDGAFVGTNASIVAPLTIGKNAYVAAGSTITEDVPDNALAIGRTRQVNKEGWVLKRKIKEEED